MNIKKRMVNTVISLIAVFLLMIVVVIHSTYVFYHMSTLRIYNEGVGKIQYVARSIDNYLINAKNILWVTADAVDEMYNTGVSKEDISQYLIRESAEQSEHFDDNFIGLYAYIDGTYIDGLNWVPPEDYEPTSRDWYKIAMEAEGEAAIVPPYLDASTGDIIISACRKLPNCDGVMAVDIKMLS